MAEFFSILRAPDSAVSATEASGDDFEEAYCRGTPVDYNYTVGNGGAKVTVYPSGSPVKYLKLRFRGDLSFVEKVYGDAWQCAHYPDTPLEWRAVVSSRVLPWYCYLYGGGKTACFGVKTGADCFAGWQVDTHGITLFLDLRNGCGGTDLREALTACEVVEYFSKEGEDPFDAACRFSKMMCDKPCLPEKPVFGVNNWYWAYGHISDQTVKDETDQLIAMTEGCVNPPYMVIDEGWERDKGVPDGDYSGGPWLPNGKFDDMARLSDYITGKGAKSGIWFRPLHTTEEVPAEAALVSHAGTTVLDPSHPYTLQKVGADIGRFVKWGYSYIKHDFSTYDAFGQLFVHDFSLCAPSRKFYDRTRTNAAIIKDFYKSIRDGAGDGTLVCGCNVFGHLSAGIHPVQRVGADTSGRNFQTTLENGVNALMRLPQNKAFYLIDPDCAAFTAKVSTKANLDFLHACALTGTVTMASVTPGHLNKEEMKRINEIYRLADSMGEAYGIANYANNANPDTFLSPDRSASVSFDFSAPYDGTRVIL